MKVKLFFEHPKNKLGFLKLFLSLVEFLGADVLLEVGTLYAAF